MFNLVIGVIVGAAFAPFWMKVWAMIKETEMFKTVMAFVKKSTDATK